MEKSWQEKIKLYLVLVLALSFVVIGYFRFLKPKGEESGKVPRAASTVSASVPKIEIQRKKHILPFESKDIKLLQEITRNIFKPGEGLDLQTANPQEEKKKKKKQKISLSRLNLEATILGDRKLAIINGQIMFPGDSVGGYQLVGIEEDGVLLKTDNSLKRLEIMNHE